MKTLPAIELQFAGDDFSLTEMFNFWLLINPFPAEKDTVRLLRVLVMFESVGEKNTMLIHHFCSVSARNCKLLWTTMVT
jgi:hypothetical protein